MSAWAYRVCKICESRVHLNSTCAEWSGTQCEGDPWKIKPKLLIEMRELEFKSSLAQKEIDLFNARIDIIKQRLG